MEGLPELTREQRMENLERALESRRRCAEVKRKVREGEWTLARALQSPDAKRVKVTQLLCCLPGVGELKAHRIMRELGIAESRRVGGLGPNQVKALSDLKTE